MPEDISLFIQQNIIWVMVVLVLSGIIIVLELQRLTKKYKDITPAEMVTLMNHNDALVLDLRTGGEVSSGTIQGAKHIAPDSLVQQIEKLGADKQRPLIGFCSQGIKAPALCRQITKSGFTNVYHLKGGITAWKQANMPVVN